MSIHSSGRILPGFLCKWFPTSCVHYLCGICLARTFEAIYWLCHLCIRIRILKRIDVYTGLLDILEPPALRSWGVQETTCKIVTHTSCDIKNSFQGAIRQLNLSQQRVQISTQPENDGLLEQSRLVSDAGVTHPGHFPCSVSLLCLFCVF